MRWCSSYSTWSIVYWRRTVSLSIDPFKFEPTKSFHWRQYSRSVRFSRRVCSSCSRQKSGVLEWCEGTITFGDYLTKVPDGAHPRYQPDDWSAMECRRHVHKATNTSKEERRRAFGQACSNLQPVFRYFFYEYFNQPSVWHRKKQAYAKSVATSSIVGYIVGLGDRHVQNILIDTQTAEVIHIDLGVAFDQGKM